MNYFWLFTRYYIIFYLINFYCIIQTNSLILNFYQVSTYFPVYQLSSQSSIFLLWKKYDMNFQQNFSGGRYKSASLQSASLTYHSIKDLLIEIALVSQYSMNIKRSLVSMYAQYLFHKLDNSNYIHGKFKRIPHIILLENRIEPPLIIDIETLVTYLLDSYFLYDSLPIIIPCLSNSSLLLYFFSFSQNR